MSDELAMEIIENLTEELGQKEDRIIELEKIERLYYISLHKEKRDTRILVSQDLGGGPYTKSQIFWDELTNVACERSKYISDDILDEIGRRRREFRELRTVE